MIVTDRSTLNTGGDMSDQPTGPKTEIVVSPGTAFKLGFYGALGGGVVWLPVWFFGWILNSGTHYSR